MISKNMPSDFELVVKNLKNLHKILQTKLKPAKWEKVLEITEEISSHVSSFQQKLEEPVRSDLMSFVEDFSNYNPDNNVETDLPNFIQFMQKGVDKNLNKLICEMNMAKLSGQEAA